jgi:oligopeptide/dipeptide ABC transporter ATP-binding protein
MVESPLLEVHKLVKHFPLGGGMLKKPHSWVKAVNGVSFKVKRGESFGVVGESGCGKTTLGRLIIGLIKPSSGRIEFDGQDFSGLSNAEMRSVRRRMQIIFQDPYSSLDPRMKVVSIITEPMRPAKDVSRNNRRDAAAELLDRVGLRPEDLDKYPHEFSGGQRQRIGIARSLCMRPELIVADEPVSALDVSIQAQVINLMEELKEDFNLSYIFISHDLSVVNHVCNRIAVMYLGSIVELAPSDNFTTAPRHPYTRALLTAVPRPDPHERDRPSPMEGDVSSPIDLPTGCTFHLRCRYAFDKCKRTNPPLLQAGPDHYVACWLNQGRGVQDS